MALKHPAAASLRLARIAFLLLAVSPLLLLAAPKPAWWTTRGAVSPQQPADDYAAANLGQLKHMAAKARDELNAALLNQGGAGPAIDALIASFGINLARLSGVAAAQSSTYNDPAANPSAAKAIDGNTAGNYALFSVARTSSEASPWWQADLGASRTIQSVEVWNQTGSVSPGLLANFYVLVSDLDMRGSNLSAPRSLASLLADGAIWKSAKVTAPPAPNLKIETGSRAGRYVMIRLEGLQQSLQLAEVKVLGVANTGAPAADDFAAATLGQLKAVAKPFYDRLYAAGYKTSYPWLGLKAAADDLAIANIGQLKNLFSFDLRPLDSTGDTNNNKVPDWWEHLYIGRLIAGSNAGQDVGSDADQDGDGVSDIQEYLAGSNPNSADTDGDGLSDAEEYALGTNPQSIDSDGDGVNDKLDFYPTDKRRSAVIPILRYVSIDVSTPITQNDNITMVALDDSNKVGFTRPTLQGIDSYSVPPGATVSSVIKKTLPSDYGHSIQSFVYHDIGRDTDLQLLLVEDYYCTVHGVNASGHLAVDAQVNAQLYRKRNEKIDRAVPVSPPQGPIPGRNEYEFPVTIASFGGAFAWTGEEYPKLTRKSLQPSLVYTTPNYRYHANGITNGDTLWGKDGEYDFNTFLGTAFFNGDNIPGFIFTFSENAEFAAGFMKSSAGDVYVRYWNNNSFHPIFDSSDTETAVTAIDNDGEIFGFSPKFKSSSYFAHREPLAQHAFWFSGSTVVDFYSALPEVFRQQVAFLSNKDTVGSSSFGGRPTLMNSAGDLLFPAAVADIQGDTPVWRRALLLWTRARNGIEAQLNEVELPEGFDLRQMNAKLALGGLLERLALNADGTPKPDPGNPSQPLKTNRAALLAPVKMMVDANRDGEMSFDNTSILGKDETTAEKPYQFWVNDDQDVETTSSAWTDRDPEKVPAITQDHTDAQIQSTRDLEDFTRLWISFKGITGMVKSQDFELKLEWKPNNGSGTWTADAGNPAIKVYKAFEPDGGRKYIEDETMATQQIGAPYNAMLADVRKTSPAVLPLSQVTQENLTETNPYLYLLFEGAREGKGQLVLTLHKGGQKIGEYPPLFLDIKNIKKMYMRGHTTPLPANFPLPYDQGSPPNPLYIAATSGALFIPYSNVNYGLGNGNEAANNLAFEKPWDEEKKCIIFVHGIDMNIDAYHSYSESGFKRLWWAGYKGRFCAFRWGTPLSMSNWNELNDGFDIFNDGEMRSWTYGPSLIGYVNHMEAKMPGARISIIGHSLGNALVGSAFEQGLVVDSYVAMEAAVSLSCYFPPVAQGQPDPLAASAMPDLLAAEASKPTPNNYNELGYRGFCRNLATGIRGKVTAYQNIDDFWLATGRTVAKLGISIQVDWVSNQKQFKPNILHGLVNDSKRYIFVSSVPRTRLELFPPSILIRPVEDAHEAMAYIARSRTRSLGAELPSLNPRPPNWGSSVDMKQLYNFNRYRFDHSGQFQRNIQLMYGDENGLAFDTPFYKRLLQDLNMVQ